MTVGPQHGDAWRGRWHAPVRRVSPDQHGGSCAGSSGQRYRKLWDFIHSRTQAKIFYHSCGSIVPKIPLLIEGGVDAVHPVQPGAAGMGDRAALKREFGVDFTFWGGFDQQHSLPFGTPDEVRGEAKRLLGDFMPGGGFVFAAGHNIQADVPPENILALFDTVFEEGCY